MAKTYSGKEVVRILTRHFGFYFVSQKGSHVKLQKKVGAKTITTIVPIHRELARGTLFGILNLGKINFEDFIKAARK